MYCNNVFHASSQKTQKAEITCFRIVSQRTSKHSTYLWTNPLIIHQQCFKDIKILCQHNPRHDQGLLTSICDLAPTNHVQSSVIMWYPYSHCTNFQDSPWVPVWAQIAGGLQVSACAYKQWCSAINSYKITKFVTPAYLDVTLWEGTGPDRCILRNEDIKIINKSHTTLNPE